MRVDINTLKIYVYIYILYIHKKKVSNKIVHTIYNHNAESDIEHMNGNWYIVLYERTERVDAVLGETSATEQNFTLSLVWHGSSWLLLIHASQQYTVLYYADIAVMTPVATHEVLLWLFGLYSRTQRQSHPLLAKLMDPKSFCYCFKLNLQNAKTDVFSFANIIAASRRGSFRARFQIFCPYPWEIQWHTSAIFELVKITELFK